MKICTAFKQLHIREIPYFCNVKRLASFILLCTFLLTATGFNQLLKLPVLLEHFTEHKAENKSISFAKFLYMHYLGYDMNDNDQDRDSSLPFKSQAKTVAMKVETAPQQLTVVCLQHLPVFSSGFVSCKAAGLSSAYLSCIWQPPRVC